MESLRQRQTCPICGRGVEASSRYPNYLCEKCKSKAADKDGRRLAFFNVSLSGGYMAQYADTKEEYDSHICYVDGVRCYAREHYWGGTVLQPREE